MSDEESTDLLSANQMMSGLDSEQDELMNSAGHSEGPKWDYYQVCMNIQQFPVVVAHLAASTRVNHQLLEVAALTCLMQCRQQAVVVVSFRYCF